MTVLRKLLLVWLSGILLALYHDGYHIASVAYQPILGESIFAEIKLNFIGVVCWIVIALFPLFEHLKRIPSNIFITLMFGSHVIVFIFITTKRTILESTIEIGSELIQVIIVLIIFSSTMHHLLSIHQDIRCEYLWFNDRFKSFSEYQYLKLVIYLLMQIIVYFHCFVWSKSCNLINILTVFQNIIITITMGLYYTLPNNIDYDLFWNGYCFNVMVLAEVMLLSHFIILANMLKYNNDRTLNLIITAIFHFITAGCMITYFVFPCWSNKHRQTKFKVMVHQNMQIKASWWEYILSDTNNYRGFRAHLINLKIFQNLLFFIEIMSYKSAVLKKLQIQIDTLHIDRGFMHNFDDCESVDTKLGINKSYLIKCIESMDIEEISANRIQSAMKILCSKYTSKYLNVPSISDENNDDLITMDNHLFVTFITKADKARINKRFQNMAGIGSLNVFDEVIVKTNEIMQLLYQVYVVNSIRDKSVLLR